MPHPDLSIIILNYKTKGLLKQCLRGIAECQLGRTYEIIVVDNNSGDGSVEMVRESFPDVTLIASPVNGGCAAGNNLGIAVARGTYVLIMNTDVALFPGSVERLTDYLDTHPQVGIAAPKLMNPDNSTQWSCYEFPNPIIPLLRRSPLGKFPVGKHLLRRYLMSDWDHQDNRAVGWVLGACLLIRRDLLERMGRFDERFFVYFEDVDLCRRCWAAGFEVHYVATAAMVHYHQRQSAESPGLGGIFSYPTRIHIRSGWSYFTKYAGRPRPPHSL